MHSPPRPVHLDLTRIKFPPMAIVSIMHRISGVVLFLLLPFALYLMHQSLLSPDSFQALQTAMNDVVMKLLLWVLISAATFHFLAGIRHMVMDCGITESLDAARLTAFLVMALEVVAMFLVGVWLW